VTPSVVDPTVVDDLVTTRQNKKVAAKV